MDSVQKVNIWHMDYDRQIVSKLNKMYKIQIDKQVALYFRAYALTWESNMLNKVTTWVKVQGYCSLITVPSYYPVYVMTMMHSTYLHNMTVK